MCVRDRCWLAVGKVLCFSYSKYAISWKMSIQDTHI